MTKENAHVDKLIAARERMIQDRRNLSEALACEYKSGHTERMRESFIISQNSIEAIDRAIAHETLIAREKPGSIVARGQRTKCGQEPTFLAATKSACSTDREHNGQQKRNLSGSRIMPDPPLSFVSGHPT